MQSSLLTPCQAPPPYKRQILTDGSSTSDKIHDPPSRYVKVPITWIPSHIRIQGNQTADQAANLGLQMSDPSCKIKLSHKEMYSLITIKIKAEWTKDLTPIASNWAINITLKSTVKTTLNHPRRYKDRTIIRLLHGYFHTQHIKNAVQSVITAVKLRPLNMCY